MHSQQQKVEVDIGLGDQLFLTQQQQQQMEQEAAQQPASEQAKLPPMFSVQSSPNVIGNQDEQEDEGEEVNDGAMSHNGRTSALLNVDMNSNSTYRSQQMMAPAAKPYGMKKTGQSRRNKGALASGFNADAAKMGRAGFDGVSDLYR